VKTVQTHRLGEYGSTSALSEADLRAAYEGPVLEARPCVCGTIVIADRRDPTEGVRLHNGEPPHVAWRLA